MTGKDATTGSTGAPVQAGFAIRLCSRRAAQVRYAHPFAETFDSVTRIDSMNQHPVKYPTRKDFQPARTPYGLSKQWPTALEVLQGSYQPNDR